MFLLQHAFTEKPIQMSSTEQLFWTNHDILRKVKRGDFFKKRTPLWLFFWKLWEIFLYCLFQDHFYANASANTVQSRNRDPANILDRELLNDH